MGITTCLQRLLVAPKPCMSSWSYTMATDSAELWDTSWTYAYLNAHGYVLALAVHMWPPLIEDLPILLGLPVWKWCLTCCLVHVKTGPTITPFRSPTCSSLCPWPQLGLTAAFAFFTSCGTCLMSKVGGIFGWHLLFPPHFYMGSSPTMVIHLTTDRLCQWHPHYDT